MTTRQARIHAAIRQIFGQPGGNAAFFRFLIVGIFNTVSGYALYLFILWLGAAPVWAYSIVYVCGTVWSYFLNLRFTFRQIHSWRKMLTFPLVYVAQYAVGLAVLKFAHFAGMPAKWAGLLALSAGAPITFFTAKFLLK